jgi:hypothetical protein
MTADLSEDETESRPLNQTSKVRLQIDEDIGPLERERLKLADLDMETPSSSSLP